MEQASDPDEPTAQQLKLEDYVEEMKVVDSMVKDSEMQGLIMYHTEAQLE